MPAGNDASAAAAELADQIGSGSGNADALIKSTRSRYQGDLGQAQLQQAEDVDVDLGAVAKAAGVESEILSATLRGDHVVFVYEDENGRAVKDVVAAEDLGKAPAAPKPEKKAKKSAHNKADAYDPKIRFGLGAIRGVGESALEAVLEARQAGPFKDLFDFAQRVDARRVNKGVLEALVQWTRANVGVICARQYERADHARYVIGTLAAKARAVPAATHANADAMVSLALAIRVLGRSATMQFAETEDEVRAWVFAAVVAIAVRVARFAKGTLGTPEATPELDPWVVLPVAGTNEPRATALTT